MYPVRQRHIYSVHRDTFTLHSISNSFILDIDGAEEAQTGIHVYIVKENRTNWGWSSLLILDKKLTVIT